MLEVGMHSLKCVGFKDVRLSSRMHDPNGDGEEMLGGDDGLFNLAQTFFWKMALLQRYIALE